MKKESQISEAWEPQKPEWRLGRFGDIVEGRDFFLTLFKSTFHFFLIWAVYISQQITYFLKIYTYILIVFLAPDSAL